MEPHRCKVLIVGSGFSGICLGIKLKQAGIEDFLILEKATEVGGTWRENTYPGAECDIPSALYSYSFEHNPEWQYKWAEQQQIFDYQKHVVEKHRLREHIRFGEEVRSATYAEDSGRWEVVTRQGGRYDCQHFISAVGQLHHPRMPAIEGLESFSGPAFHSARWDHGVELGGKRVGVIGNAASALQFIPQIAPQVGHLTVFQRSANWVLPKADRPYKPWEQKLSDRFPWLTRLYRLRIWLRCDGLLYQIIRGNPLIRRFATWRSLHNMRRYIKDPALQQALTPDYPIGARRVLFSDDYYQALARDNVRVETKGIARVTEAGVETVDGREEAFDVLIYGTGFYSNPFLASMEICGLGGQRLRDHWFAGAHAYLGMTTHGFPNLFMLYGPNTNLGHNSIIYMIERQCDYIVQCIQGMEGRGWEAMDVREAVEADYNTELQRRLARMAFAEVDTSWYMDRGRITNNWAGSTLEYGWRVRKVDWDNFEARA